MSTWSLWLQKLGIGGAVSRGAGARPKDHDTDLTSPLDCAWPACSSIGLVALLARLGLAPKSNGGLVGGADRTAVRSYLCGVIDAAIRGGVKLILFMGGSSEWDAPMPLAGVSPMVIEVDNEGMVHRQPLVEGTGARQVLLRARLTTGRPHSSTAGARKGDMCHLADIFEATLQVTGVRAASDKAHLHDMFKQLCIRVGLAIDTMVSRSLDSGGSDDAFSVKPVVGDITERKYRDAMSVSYWKQVHDMGREHMGLPLSCTADFTCIGKRNVFDCAVVFPSGVAGWLPPQVTLESPTDGGQE